MIFYTFSASSPKYHQKCFCSLSGTSEICVLSYNNACKIVFTYHPRILPLFFRRGGGDVGGTRSEREKEAVILYSKKEKKLFYTSDHVPFGTRMRNIP